MNYKITIDGKQYSVNVKGITGDRADVEVNGKAYSVDVEQTQKAFGPKPQRQAVPATATAQAPQPQSQMPANGKAVTAPLPGVIIHLMAAPGQTVKKGERIAVLEAMKMENNLLAPVDGTIASVAVHQGDSVLEGALIATIE